jgi:hypothetical protein
MPLECALLPLPSVDSISWKWRRRSALIAAAGNVLGSPPSSSLCSRWR